MRLSIARIQNSLTRLRELLVAELGAQLVSLVVYGDVVKSIGRHISSVNVLIVVDQIDGPLMSRVSIAIRAVETKIPLAVMLMTTEELKTSCDVFPIKFRDITIHHQRLHGADLLTNLDISSEHLRLRAEQQLKNLLLRLRFARLSANTLLDHNRLSQAFDQFLVNVRATLTLSNKIVAEDDNDVLSQLSDTMSIDVDAGKNFLQIRDQKDWERLPAIVDPLLELIANTANAVDKLETVS